MHIFWCITADNMLTAYIDSCMYNSVKQYIIEYIIQVYLSKIASDFKFCCTKIINGTWSIYVQSNKCTFKVHVYTVIVLSLWRMLGSVYTWDRWVHFLLLFYFILLTFLSLSYLSWFSINVSGFFIFTKSYVAVSCVINYYHKSIEFLPLEG